MVDSRGRECRAVWGDRGWGQKRQIFINASDHAERMADPYLTLRIMPKGAEQTAHELSAATAPVRRWGYCGRSAGWGGAVGWLGNWSGGAVHG